MQQSAFEQSGNRDEATEMFYYNSDNTTHSATQPHEYKNELLNNYYALMFDAINGHGGVVNQMVGDGLMAIFGAPLPLPDHGAAAVRAALDMVEMIDLLNVERTAAGKPEIRIGVGIATGDMVAGYTGTQQRATYTCIGDTVNLAARLEEHTKLAKRTILLDPATCMALGGRIPVESLGAASMRGKATAVEVYAVTEADRSKPAS